MTAPADIRGCVRHVRQAGFCAAGLRKIARSYDREKFARFCREGLPVDELDALGDAYSRRIAQIAREEAARG